MLGIGAWKQRMGWWDDLWLNEAFATWMQQKVTQKVHPEYRADLDRVRGAQGAMNGDSLVTTRKIRQPITGNGDIETAFDGITYQKGAAVLGMRSRCRPVRNCWKHSAMACR